MKLIILILLLNKLNMHINLQNIYPSIVIKNNY